MSIIDFEKELLSGNVDLSNYAEAEPLKSSEDIRAEWLLQRRGKFTASAFSRLTAYPSKDELSEGAKTYATEKAVELITIMNDAERYVSASMQWGIDNELKAVEAFTRKTGLPVSFTGDNQKLLTLGDDIGGTPDGLIDNDSGVEIKCPIATTHFKYLGIKNNADLKKESPEYYWQIMGLMMLSGAKNWHFVSYNPLYINPVHQLHIVLIERDEADISFLQIRLSMAIAYRNYLLSKI
jgi:hypothetical protein